MGYKIKIAETEKEIQEITNLAKKIWHDTYDVLIGREQVDYMLEKYQSVHAITEAVQSDHYRYYIAAEKEKVLGFCGLKPEPESNRLFVSKIYVDPTYQKNGIARRFFLTAKCFAEEQNKEILYLTVNKENANAIAVYKHFGFEITENVVTDIGHGYVMDDYIMEYRI